MSGIDPIRDAALEAISRGYHPIPIHANLKRPTMANWTSITWDPATTVEQFEAKLREWGFDPAQPYNLGVNLGPISGHLVDVDIDHPKAKRFRDFLPRTQARSGRPGSPDSHYWYIVEEGATGNRALDVIPSTRRYKLADNTTVTIEFRYDRGVQTVIPPSDWVPKDWDNFNRDPALREIRTWSRDPWGGPDGPARVNGRRLAVQVALIGLATVLLNEWPKAGTRHEAYLALAGALLRQGDGLVHPFWEKNVGVLIRALADAAEDDDGPDARESETVPSTIDGIRNGKMIWGFPKLAEIVGDDTVTMARTLVAEVESLAGFVSRAALGAATPPPASPPPAPPSQPPASGAPSPAPATPPAPGTPSPSDDSVGPGADGEPLEAPPEAEVNGSWKPVDLDPYLTGQFSAVEPTVLRRNDGKALFYRGRVNMMFAPSESGKTLIALHTCCEVMASGARVVFIDFEDEPVNTIERLRSMGASDDELRLQFTYLRPDEPIAQMQRDKWGGVRVTPVGEANAKLFAEMLNQVNPALIVADGMTSIYGLHGLDSNSSVETEVINSWLRSLSRNGDTTVIVIDHMAKASGRGDMPLGSQHKVSMVQGTLLQVWPKTQPVLGQKGELELIVLKDRPGQVRKYAGRLNGKAQIAAIVEVDSTQTRADGSTITDISVSPPPPPAPGTVTVGTSTATRGRNAAAARQNGNVVLRERDRQELVQILAIYGGVAGTQHTYPAAWALVSPAWLAASNTQARFKELFGKLITWGYLEKDPTGPDRNGARYELTQRGTQFDQDHPAPPQP